MPWPECQLEAKVAGDQQVGLPSECWPRKPEYCTLGDLLLPGGCQVFSLLFLWLFCGLSCFCLWWSALMLIFGQLIRFGPRPDLYLYIYAYICVIKVINYRATYLISFRWTGRGFKAHHL